MELVNAVEQALVKCAVQGSREGTGQGTSRERGASVCKALSREEHWHSQGKCTRLGSLSLHS